MKVDTKAIRARTLEGGYVESVPISIRNDQLRALCDRVEELERACEKLAAFCERQGYVESAKELRRVLA